MKIDFKLQGLEKFTKMINNINDQEAHIGFLGEEKNTRTEGEITNADLAATHHFGSLIKQNLHLIYMAADNYILK